MLDEDARKRCVADLVKALCGKDDTDSTSSQSPVTSSVCAREDRLGEDALGGTIFTIETRSGATTAASPEVKLLEAPQQFTQKFFTLLVEHVISTETVEEVFGSVLDAIIKTLQEQTIGHFLTNAAANSSPVS